MDPFSISLYDLAIPINMSALVFTLGYWAMSVSITAILTRMSDTFKAMEIRHKRNVVTYFLEIFATTTSFFLLTCMFPRLITISRISDPFTKDEITLASVGIGLVFYLYIFEIVYKTHINSSLLVQHVLMILMTCLTCFMLWDTLNPASVYTMILVYSATTEQPVFVALLLYRFGYRCRWWFRVAAVTGVLFKTIVFCLGFLVFKRAILDVEFVNHRNDFQWKRFVVVVFPIVNVLLLIVQVHCTRLYWVLGEKSHVSQIINAGGDLPTKKNTSTSTLRMDSIENFDLRMYGIDNNELYTIDEESA